MTYKHNVIELLDTPIEEMRETTTKIRVATNLVNAYADLLEALQRLPNPDSLMLPNSIIAYLRSLE